MKLILAALAALILSGCAIVPAPYPYASPGVNVGVGVGVPVYRSYPYHHGYYRGGYRYRHWY